MRSHLVLPLVLLALGATPGCVTELTWQKLCAEEAQAPRQPRGPLPRELVRAARTPDGVYHFEVACSDDEVRHVAFDPGFPGARAGEPDGWPSASCFATSRQRALPVAIVQERGPFPDGVPLAVLSPAAADSEARIRAAPAVALRGVTVWLREAPDGELRPLATLVYERFVRRSDPYGGRTRSMRRLVGLCLLPFTLAIDGALLPVYLIALPAM